MNLQFRPEAEAEALEARRWYAERSPELGRDFAKAVSEAIAAIDRNPEYPVIEEDCRRILLRRFPYSLINFRRSSELLVVAVFHQRREPGSWAQRVES